MLVSLFNNSVVTILSSKPNNEVTGYPKISDKIPNFTCVDICVVTNGKLDKMQLETRAMYPLSLYYNHLQDHNFSYYSYISSDSLLHTMDVDTSFHS